MLFTDLLPGDKIRFEKGYKFNNEEWNVVVGDDGRTLEIISISKDEY